MRREIALGLGVYVAYLGVRRLVLARDGRRRGRANAERIVALERKLGVDIEPAAQRVLLRFPRLVHALNVGYAAFNVTLTIGWLVLLYRRRDPGYHRLRRACVLAYVGAQPFFFLFPASPPRVLDEYVDTLSEVSGVDIEHPLLIRFYNPVAALPSLHVAFATVTASAIVERSGTPLAKAAYGYPAVVSLVVAGTGNHFFLDVVAGAALGLTAKMLS